MDKWLAWECAAGHVVARQRVSEVSGPTGSYFEPADGWATPDGDPDADRCPCGAVVFARPRVRLFDDCPQPVDRLSWRDV